MRSLGLLRAQESLCAAYLRERGSLLGGHKPQGQVVLTLLGPLLWRQPGLGLCLDRPLRQDLPGLRKGSRSRPWGSGCLGGLGSWAGELTGLARLSRVVSHRPQPLAVPAT
jgi:hypothetical protein